MSAPTRRLMLGAALSLVAALPALAAEKLIEAGQVFKYLDVYLKIPAAERTHFVVAYYLTVGGKPVTGVHVSLISGGVRTPVPIGADGRVLRLPTLRELQTHAQMAFDVAPTTKFGLRLGVEPLVRPALDLDAAYLTFAVAQAQAGVKKAGGLIGFMIPNMERVWLPGAEGAEVVYADGRRARLPVVKGMAVFDPSAWRGARTLHFTRAPTRLDIGPAK